MKFFLFFFATLIMTNLGKSQIPPTAFESDFKTHAKAAIGEVKSTFMKELMSALKDGPYQALNHCHLKAPHLSNKKYNGISVGRSSDKLRNKANQAAPWVNDQIQHYKNNPTKKDGQIVRISNNELGYVEPIYMKEICLNCHGRNVSPSLKEQLKRKYPEDMAIEYTEGDFRGVFWAHQKR